MRAGDRRGHHGRSQTQPLVIKAYLGIADDTDVPDIIPAVI